jgi:hypothetical protein
MKFTTPLLALTLVGMVACSETAGPLALEPENALFSSAPTRTTMNFRAVAGCSNDTGENIAFGGIIENQLHETRDARGKVHRHRIFRARGMTGTGVESGTHYEVIGGAEMFSWQFDEAGTQRILIHQGNLVFQAEDHKVIAHHTIRQVPGQEETLNFWTCRRVAG